MSDVRKTLEDILEAAATTLLEQVKAKDCPASTLAAAIKLLKDNGIEARASKGSPLGNLAASLPTFDKDEQDGDGPSYN